VPLPIAHTGVNGGDAQRLVDHLAGVARRAEVLAESIRPGDEGFRRMATWAGWLHDLGKYREEFQQYIRGRRPSSRDTQHSVFGAAWAGRKGLSSASFAVLGHHSGLHDFSNWKNALVDPSLTPLNEADLLMEQLLAEAGATGLPPLGPPPEWLKPRGKTIAAYADDLRIRMLFSCLIDADRLDSERHGQGKEREPQTFEAPVLFKRINSYVHRKSAGVDPTVVNQVRDEVYRDCLKAADLPQGCFSLTAPTGAGKTLASMAFALKHAENHDLRRVIVVLPFLAIIEQNASVYRDALTIPVDRDTVLEHHSAVVESADSKSDAENEDQKPNPQRTAQATENWDAPVIVTTAVQFLESLFSRRPSRCRKLHNIARSVVIFDEVQTLPFDLLDPILSAIRDLRDDFGVSFLFSSATQPTFQKSVNLPSGFAEGECREVVSEPAKTFTILRRATLELPFLPDVRWSWDHLADQLVATPRALIIVNLRKHAQDLYDVLNQRGASAFPKLFHLSGSL
jgi:CRISPR-associated endonuclease/helicase Cas3